MWYITIVGTLKVSYQPHKSLLGDFSSWVMAPPHKNPNFARFCASEGGLNVQFIPFLDVPAESSSANPPISNKSEVAPRISCGADSV